MKNLSELIAEAEEIVRRVEQTFGGLNTDQINWKPDEKSWSIAQCFEHLIITNNLYFPIIQKVIDGKHRDNFFSKIPFAADLIGALMKNSLKPEQTRKMKTFKIFEPAESNIANTIFDDFNENQRKLIAMIEACKSLNVHKIKIPEPLSPMLNLRLSDAFEILVIHEKRHFQQAERILKRQN